ncbi:unnamed protein product [Symbiodinium sp. KB8]|nr:unnamed protein product [Symbiodinium sp. KB8]
MTPTEPESSKKPRSTSETAVPADDVAARRAELERLDRLLAEKRAELLLQDFESRARSESERKAREAELQKARQDAELQKAREAAEQKAREDAELQKARTAAEQKAREEAELQKARELAELQKAQEAELQKAREAELQKAREAELQKAQLEAELQKAREAELLKAREAELQKAREAELQKARDAELQKAREAELKAREAELKAREEAELQKARDEPELQKARELAELQKAREDAELQKAREEAELLKAHEEAELHKARGEEAELQRAQQALAAEQKALEAELKARAEARAKAQAERAAREEASFEAHLAEQRVHTNAELSLLRKKKEVSVRVLEERQKAREETLRLLQEQKAKVQQLKLELGQEEQPALSSADKPSSPRPSALKRSGAFLERGASFQGSEGSPAEGPTTPPKPPPQPSAVLSPPGAPSEASVTSAGSSQPKGTEVRTWESATPEEWATLTQNCRRCCFNYQRASMEMVQAWEAGGSVRKELLKKWWSNPSVATVTAEILFSELHLEPGAQKTTHLSDFLTAEGVLAFYHNNSDKAKAAIQEAMIEGRWKQDPNLKNDPNARLFRLVVQDRMEESHEKFEQIKAKVVPLAADKRPEAKETGHAPILDAAPAPAPAETPQAKATQSQAPQAAPATRAATPGEETPAGLAAPAFGGILQCLDVNRSHVLESELVGGADGVAKAKAKAKAGKKKGGENPKAVFDVRKAKISSLTGAFPLVDRAATKELLSSVMLGKAGQMAKIALQLQGHAASSKAMEDLTKAKAEMDAKWELKKIDDQVPEDTWVDAMKDITRSYFNYLSKEEFAAGCCRSVKKQEVMLLQLQMGLAQSGIFVRKLMCFVVLRVRMYVICEFQLLTNASVHEAAASFLVATSIGEGLRDWSEAELPTALTTDEGYSTLDHMVDTPMGNVVLKSLRKKGADVRFMCSEVCSAAVEEGSQKYSTRLLSRIRDERAFHNKLAKFLPRVEKLKFPAQIKKKLVMKDFRPDDVFLRIHGDEGPFFKNRCDPGPSAGVCASAEEGADIIHSG